MWTYRSGGAHRGRQHTHFVQGRLGAHTHSLIDFAHTQFVPGQGPDMGVLLGMGTPIRLVHEWWEAIKTLAADIGEECS